MSLVNYCIDHVIDGPNPISDYALRLAFDNPVSGFGYPQYNVEGNDSNYSIRQGIREKIIYKMIGKMVNASGGTTELIDLSSSRVRYMGNGSIAVNVPDTVTGGREILSVRQVYPGIMTSTLASAGGNVNGRCGNSAFNSQLNNITRGLSNDAVTTAFTNITPTGRNSFVIREAGLVIYNLIAEVMMSYDDQFSIIPPPAYEYFGKLTVIGTQAYIYKQCRRGLKEGVRRFGFSLDELQDEIDGYADAHREYEELYMKIKKILKYADPKGVSNHISMTVPRRL